VTILEAADRPGAFVPNTLDERLVDLGELRLNDVVAGKGRSHRCCSFRPSPSRGATSR